jgi:hypothetical protein
VKLRPALIASILLLAAALAPAQAQPCGLDLQLATFKTPSGNYTMALISSAERNYRGMPLESDLAAELKRRADAWAIAERRAAFKGLVPAEFFDRLEREYANEESPFRMLVFFKGAKERKDAKEAIDAGDFRQVEAVVQLAGPGAHDEKLPLERALGLPSSQPKVFTYGNYDFLGSSEDYAPHWGYGHAHGDPEIQESMAPRLHGATAEIEKFTIRRGASDGFLGILMNAISFGHASVGQGNWRLSIAPPSDRLPPGYENVGWDGYVRVNTDRYRIRCHPKMEKYYNRIGFTFAAQKEGDFVMESTRLDFMKKTIEFRQRKGFNTFWDTKEYRTITDTRQAYRTILEQRYRSRFRDWKKRVRFKLKQADRYFFESSYPR